MAPWSGDFGIQAEGGLQAGIHLARICLADLAQVEMVPGDADVWPGAWVTVATDNPVLSCMASQYAGMEGANVWLFRDGLGTHACGGCDRRAHSEA